LLEETRLLSQGKKSKEKKVGEDRKKKEIQGEGFNHVGLAVEFAKKKAGQFAKKKAGQFAKKKAGQFAKKKTVEFAKKKTVEF